MTATIAKSSPEEIWAEVMTWAKYAKDYGWIRMECPEVSRLAFKLGNIVKAQYGMCRQLTSLYCKRQDWPLPDLPPYVDDSLWWERLMEEYKEHEFLLWIDKDARAEKIRQNGLTIKALKRFENPYDYQTQHHMFILVDFSRQIANVPLKRDDKFRHLRDDRLSFRDGGWMEHIRALEAIQTIARVRRSHRDYLFN